jgi:MerR family transcriptional regulator, light-induced transcriptional regulator
VHPISVVAERTGLSSDLLRVWERRYGVVDPTRDDSGRRLYTDADVERLRLLALATAAGRNISQLVDLAPGELDELVRSDEAARRKPARVGGVGEEEGHVVRALNRARALDADGLDVELSRAAAVLGAAQFMEAVVAPLCRRIGDGWHSGEITIAQEHMSTRVVQQVLGRVIRALPVDARAPAVVVAAPAGDRHEVGALLAATACALEGWRVTYLGADVPAADIAGAALDTGARLVALSSVYPGGSALVAEVAELREALPAHVGILVGGAGAASLNGVAGHVEVLPDLAALRQRLASA